jgi:hypothetical protein
MLKCLRTRVYALFTHHRRIYADSTQPAILLSGMCTAERRRPAASGKPAEIT